MLTNGTIIASANLSGIGATISTGSVNNQAGAFITGALDGLVNTGTAVVTNAGHVLGQTVSGVALKQIAIRWSHLIA